MAGDAARGGYIRAAALSLEMTHPDAALARCGEGTSRAAVTGELQPRTDRLVTVLEETSSVLGRGPDLDLSAAAMGKGSSDVTAIAAGWMPIPARKGRRTVAAGAPSKLLVETRGMWRIALLANISNVGLVQVGEDDLPGFGGGSGGGGDEETDIVEGADGWVTGRRSAGVRDAFKTETKDADIHAVLSSGDEVTTKLGHHGMHKGGKAKTGSSTAAAFQVAHVDHAKVAIKVSHQDTVAVLDVDHLLAKAEKAAARKAMHKVRRGEEKETFAAAAKAAERRGGDGDVSSEAEAAAQQARMHEAAVEARAVAAAKAEAAVDAKATAAAAVATAKAAEAAEAEAEEDVRAAEAIAARDAKKDATRKGPTMRTPTAAATKEAMKSGRGVDPKKLSMSVDSAYKVLAAAQAKDEARTEDEAEDEEGTSGSSVDAAGDSSKPVHRTRMADASTAGAKGSRLLHKVASDPAPATDDDDAVAALGAANGGAGPALRTIVDEHGHIVTVHDDDGGGSAGVRSATDVATSMSYPSGTAPANVDAEDAFPIVDSDLDEGLNHLSAPLGDSEKVVAVRRAPTNAEFDAEIDAVATSASMELGQAMESVPFARLGAAAPELTQAKMRQRAGKHHAAKTGKPSKDNTSTEDDDEISKAVTKATDGGIAADGATAPATPSLSEYGSSVGSNFDWLRKKEEVPTAQERSDAADAIHRELVAKVELEMSKHGAVNSNADDATDAKEAADADEEAQDKASVAVIANEGMTEEKDARTTNATAPADGEQEASAAAAAGAASASDKEAVGDAIDKMIAEEQGAEKRDKKVAAAAAAAAAAVSEGNIKGELGLVDARFVKNSGLHAAASTAATPGSMFSFSNALSTSGAKDAKIEEEALVEVKSLRWREPALGSLRERPGDRYSTEAGSGLPPRSALKPALTVLGIAALVATLGIAAMRSVADAVSGAFGATHARRGTGAERIPLVVEEGDFGTAPPRTPAEPVGEATWQKAAAARWQNHFGDSYNGLEVNV